jgi:tetratricopeptide (TPR) repeat protein
MLGGRYADAIEQFTQILDESPGYYVSHESIGLTYILMGRWRDALTSFRRLVAVAPGDYLADCYTRIAEVYDTQGEYEVAESELEKALKLDPESVRAHWLKGIVSIDEGGRLEAPRQELDTIRGLLDDPRSAGKAAYLHHLAGRIQIEEGGLEGGLRALLNAVGSSEKSETNFFRRELARGYLKAGRPDECIREASALLERNPNDAEMLSAAGLAHKQLGETEEMIASFTRAMNVWKEADADFAPLAVVAENLR